MPFTKGNIPWNKGKCHHYIQGENHPMWGKHHTKEVKEKISSSKKGNSLAWNKGLKMTEDFKKKMDFSGLKLGRLGNKRTLGSRRKMSEVAKIIAKERGKEYYKKIGMNGLLKQQIMKEPTSIEKKLYKELKRCGLLFETQKLINGKFLVDAYIPRLNLIIEADGDYWHSLNRIKKKDKAENAYLKKCGFNLLRFSESEINNTNFGERILG